VDFFLLIATIFRIAHFSPCKRKKAVPVSGALFRWRLVAKRHLHGCAHAAFPRINIELVADTSIPDQIALVPKTDCTGAPSEFTLWLPLILLAWIGRWPVASKKQCKRVRINFAVGRDIPPFPNPLLLIE
jgi:hypothetical protein